MMLKQYIPLPLFFLLYLAFSLSLSSCSNSSLLSGPKELERPKGRCTANEHCPPGFRCRETFCEDIYYPQRRIKP